MSVVIAIDAGTTGVRAFAVDERGQPPPTRIRIDLRQSNIRIGDTQQIIE